MTLKGVIAIMLHHFTEIDSFAGPLRHSGWSYRPKMSAKYRLLFTYGQN